MTIQALLAAINADPELQRRGRHYTCQIKLEIGEQSLLFSVRDGQLERIEEGVDAVRDSITLTANADAWRAFRGAHPPPGYHDLAAMQDQGHLMISGDVLRWISNMGYVRGLVKHWRQANVCSP